MAGLDPATQLKTLRMKLTLKLGSRLKADYMQQRPDGYPAALQSFRLS
jgi:hypothetical protein